MYYHTHYTCITRPITHVLPDPLHMYYHTPNTLIPLTNITRPYTPHTPYTCTCVLPSLSILNRYYLVNPIMMSSLTATGSAIASNGTTGPLMGCPPGTWSPSHNHAHPLKITRKKYKVNSIKVFIRNEYGKWILRPQAHNTVVL